ncbi:MAG: hypothetical protein U1A27_00045 [Phycisphaerae bacterium]
MLDRLIGFARRVKRADRDHERRLAALERAIFGAAAAAQAFGLGGGGNSWRALASQEEIALLKVDAVAASVQTANCRRVYWDASGALVNDDEHTGTVVLQLVMGASPFIGAIGFGRYCGLNQGVPMYLPMAGDWHGMLAKTTSGYDSSWTVAWSTTGIGPTWRPVLTDSSPGCGRALDLRSVGNDSFIGGDRVALSIGTPIWLKKHPLNTSYMAFALGTDQNSTATCA